MPRSSTRDKLLDAKQRDLIVKFSRPFEVGTFTGYVLGVGKQFFVIASLGDGFEHEQFIFLRVKDVRSLQSPAKHAPFYRAVRETRHDVLPSTPDVALDNARTILQSAGQVLVTIYREEQDAGICTIGYPVEFQSDGVTLIEISGDGEWDPEPTIHTYAGITRIDLPGPYELALTTVSGFPPNVEGGKAARRVKQLLDPRTPSRARSSL